MKIKQVLTSLFILIGMITLLGGCRMDREISEQNDKALEIQSKMAQHMIKSYEGITEIIFLDYYVDKVTGYISSEVLVNNKYKVILSYADGSDKVTANYYADFDLPYKSSSVLNEKTVKITYYRMREDDGSRFTE